MNVCAYSMLRNRIVSFARFSRVVVRITAVLGLVSGLNGCALWVHELNGSPQLLVSADKLDVSNRKSDDYKYLVDIGSKTEAEKKEFLGRVALDSRTKCETFVNGLVIAENTVNTAGDITSLVLTGLASVFKPLTTVHGLTAGATAVTGSKSAVNANIYAKTTAVTFQSAMRQSYDQAMLDYTNELPQRTSVIASKEVDNIAHIHSMCTLAATQDFILSKFNSSGQVPAKPTNLVATAVSGGIQLTWTAVPGATTYNVFQGTSPGGESSAPVATGITGNTHTVSPLAIGAYYFYVTAQNSAGSSAKSDEVPGNVAVAAPAAPAAPPAVEPPSPPAVAPAAAPTPPPASGTPPH